VQLLQLGLPRVLEYSSTTPVVNYPSDILLLEYSLISISGCKCPFPVAVFLQPIDNFTPIRCNVLPQQGEKPQNRHLRYLNSVALHSAAGSNIGTDRPVHHPLLHYWQLELKYFRCSRVLEYSLRYSDEYSSRKLLSFAAALEVRH